MMGRAPAAVPHAILKRQVVPTLTPAQSHASVLHLYRKVCRLIPPMLKAYELEGDDSYEKAVRNIRYYFEHNRQLNDLGVIESLRHKAEMEIQETLMGHKTKSHVAALAFVTPDLSSMLRAQEIAMRASSSAGAPQLTSPFLSSFLAGN